MVLDFDLDMFTLEPLDHELIFLTRRETGPDRFPRPTRSDAAVFRLGDADQTFFRHRVDGMVINLKAPFELPCYWLASREASRFGASA